MRACSVGRPRLTETERETLLEATRRFVSTVEKQSGERAAELAKELLHDGKRGKKDESSDSELARDWSVLRKTMTHPRWLSRLRLLQAMETAARLYGWTDDTGVMALLDCADEHIERLADAARRHDDDHYRDSRLRWVAQTRYLMDRFGWPDEKFAEQLRSIRASVVTDRAIEFARVRAIAAELPPPEALE